MAQRIHAKIRNKTRASRYSHRRIIDEDIIAALLLWKFKDENEFPSFYEPVVQDTDAEDLISEHGQEWLCNNKVLADQFLDDCDRINNDQKPQTKTLPMNKDDRYARLFEDDLYSNCTYPLWPEGFSGIIPVLLWAWSYYYGFYFYAYRAGLTADLPMHMPSNINVWAFRMFYFLLTTHICEAALVWMWLIPLKLQFTLICRLSWCWYAFVCGWPCTGKAKILCQIALTKQEQKTADKVKKRVQREKEKEKEKGVGKEKKVE